jgi:predicted metal-binding membrane protein
MLSDWRDGIAGALAMGVRYAAWCLGCCWLVMAVLFVAGAMSIPWAIAISAYVLLERLLPLPRAFDRAAGAAIAALGLWRLLAA